MQDTGILQKLMQRGYYAAYGQAGRSATLESEVRENKPIIQENMLLVYIGLGIGTFLSLAAFVTEIIAGKCTRRARFPDKVNSS